MSARTTNGRTPGARRANAPVPGGSTTARAAGRARVRGAGRVLTTLLLAGSLAVLPATTAHADGIRDQQWALDAMHIQQVWATTKGKGITVAVLDTGVDAEHPDLTGNVLDGKDMVGFGASRGDRAWARHGTAMAGIIAAHGHGAGDADGVVGVAPEARILPVRVILEDGDPARGKARNTRGNALAEGIRWATDHGADVINLSLGDDSRSAHPEPAEDAAVQYALKRGVAVVASAGNGGEKGDHISYPAAYPGVIAATAVDRYGTRASFSTRRWYATVSAPGVDVVIADPDDKYYEGWGTSAASAFVSGAVALIRAAHPGLTPAQIKQLLEDTARNAPKSGRDDARGYGFIDPAAAMDAAGDLKPEGLHAAAYGRKYFGPGPDEAVDDEDTAGWVSLLAGGLGAVLLAAAVVLWRGRRNPRHPFL
ncbi:type VII secretion-associated serine protease mycosin [Streptomyces sp. NPDC008313]|uniref:type VII secretion-associated serine protease mycosin n=1 Tax=Streptomyces sp. NPDC008313 TaxID=3364826 RepID=UPI0036E60BF2